MMDGGPRAEAMSRLRGDRVDPSRPILVVARSSGGAGQSTREGCVENYLAACGLVQVVAGNGSRQSASSLFVEELLLQRLERAQSRRYVDENGKGFVIGYCYLEDLRHLGIVGMLVVGSAAKVTSSGTQPATEAIARAIRKFQPSVVVATENARMVREPWARREIARAMPAGSSVFTDRDGWWTAEDEVATFMNDVGARREAATIVNRTRRGQRLKTGGPTRFVGSVTYGLAYAAPPGTVSLRLKGNTSEGPKVLCLDRPEDLPPDDAVAHGMPDVWTTRGERVDQVANVREALEMYALGRSCADIIRMLVDGRYSTEGIRRRHGAGATASDFVSSSDVLGSLLSNLEFYATGRLVRHVSDEHERHEVALTLEPEGGWISPEVAAAARQRFSEEKEARSSRKGGPRLTFVGLPVEVVGVGGALTRSRLAKWRSRGERAELVYVPKLNGTGIRIPAADLHRSIAEGIANLPPEVVAEVVVRADLESESDSYRRYGQVCAQIEETDGLLDDIARKSLRVEDGSAMETRYLELSAKWGALLGELEQEKAALEAEFDQEQRQGLPRAEVTVG